jgi:hypothetical protein
VHDTGEIKALNRIPHRSQTQKSPRPIRRTNPGRAITYLHSLGAGRGESNEMKRQLGGSSVWGTLPCTIVAPPRRGHPGDHDGLHGSPGQLSSPSSPDLGLAGPTPRRTIEGYNGRKEKGGLSAQSVKKLRHRIRSRASIDDQQLRLHSPCCSVPCQSTTLHGQDARNGATPTIDVRDYG